MSWLGNRMKEVPLPPAPAARERVVVAARAEAAASRRAPEATPHRRRGLRFAIVAVLAATAIVATPPGRTAAAWVGDLVGIGEIGGVPSKQKRLDWESSSPLVVNNGAAPDGSRYEWAASKCVIDGELSGPEGGKTRGVSLSLEWPGVKAAESTGSCAPRGNADGPMLESVGISIVPSQRKGVARPDVVIQGSTGPRVDRLRAVYTDGRGDRRDLTLDFSKTSAPLTKKAGYQRPVGTFTGFIDGAMADRDALVECLDLKFKHTGGWQSEADDGLKSKECRDRPGGAPERSPVVLEAYDAQGNRLGREAVPAPGLTGPAELSERDGSPTRPSAVGRRAPGTYGNPVTLTTGQTSDGLQYETLAERYRNKAGKVSSYCVRFYLPNQRAVSAPVNCDSGLIPSGALDDAAAKPRGFLEELVPASEDLLLSGYAKASVARVRVVYDSASGQRDADVKFARVRGDRLERLGGRPEFGFFSVTLPGSLRDAYSGSANRAEGKPAIRVLSYDEAGNLLDTVPFRN